LVREVQLRPTLMYLGSTMGAGAAGLKSLPMSPMGVSGDASCVGASHSSQGCLGASSRWRGERISRDSTPSPAVIVRR
jgi:hypothetical protein